MTSTPHETRADYDRDLAAVREAAEAYYNSDIIVLDDPTYDALMHKLAATEAAHPDWVTGASVTAVVAAGAGTGDVAHSVPMLSLDNVFSPEELRAWAAGLASRLGRPVGRFTVEPKMDGMAIAARYVDGTLTELVTRGDGSHGESVSHAIGTIAGLPGRLVEPVTVEVRGEVLLTDEQFEAANELRVAHGDNPFVNPRNGVAGALRAKDRGYRIPMTFFCYGVGGGYLADVAHSEAMAQVSRLGVQTTAASVAGLAVLNSAEDVAARVVELGEMRERIGFAVDGAVIKADGVADRAEAGFSSRAPRWAIAYKYPADAAVSTLEEVLWQVGRTGVITPRARVTPVFVGGTTVTFATLHNPDDITRKGFLLGDQVSVIRAGEVIPRLEAPLVNLRTGDETPIVTPAACPRCGGDIDKSQARWRCVRGRACGLVEAVDYAASRDALDIEGLGTQLVRQVVDAGLVSDVADIFALSTEALADLDRMGPASAAKVVAQIEAAKSQPLSRVFCALGVRGTGRSMSRRIAKHFATMDAIRSADVAALVEVDGIGSEKAPVILAELAELAHVIDKLIAAGVNMAEPTASRATVTDGAGADADAGTDLPLAGLTVCVSGTVPGLSRTQAQEAVERLGGKSSSSVSKRTDLLVAGDGAGSKLEKADALGVKVMDAAKFAELAAAS